MIRRILAVAALIVFVCSLSACNTVHGLGKDIESGGKAIEKSSGK
jgi:entericidin B